MSADLFITRYIPTERDMGTGRNSQSGPITRPSLGPHAQAIGRLYTRASNSLVSCEMPTQEQFKTAMEMGYTEEQLSRKTASKINEMIANKLAKATEIQDGTNELTELTDLINQSKIIITKQELDFDTVRAFYNKKNKIDLAAIEHDLELLKNLDTATNTTKIYNESKGLSRALLNGLYPQDSRIIISQARAITGAQHLESNGDREAVVIGIGTRASLSNGTGSDQKTAIKVYVKANKNDDPRAVGQDNYITQINTTSGRDAKKREFTIQPENIVSFID